MDKICVVEMAGKVKRENISFELNEKEFKCFVQRIAGDMYAEKIVARQKTSTSGYDEYEMYDEKGKVVIEATSGSAAGVAFNRYLQEKCNYYVGMLTTVGMLPETPPNVGEKAEDWKKL